jgi:hypothetical protein
MILFLNLSFKIGEAYVGVKFNTRLHIVPNLKMRGVMPPLSICHGGPYAHIA